MPSTANTAEQLARCAGSLYSLPAVAVEVMELTDQPQVDLTRLRRCIENDPALTAKVLKVVNCSSRGLRCPIFDLQQALALLGIKPLKLLVLGFSLPERLLVGVAADVLTHYWRRAMIKSVAARELCQRHWQHVGDDAFVAGLLSGVGQLVLLKEVGEPYAALLRQVVEEHGDLPAREVAALGFDHLDLSARLLGRWGFPAALTQAIADPKHLESLRKLSGSQARLPQVLHLAELLAQLVTEQRIGALPELLEAGLAYRRLTRTEFTPLLSDLTAQVEQLAEVLCLEPIKGENYHDVLVTAHARLAELTEDAVGNILRNAREETELCADVLDQSRELSVAAQTAGQFERSPGSSAAFAANAELRTLGIRGDRLYEPSIDGGRSHAADCTTQRTPIASTVAAALQSAVATCRQSRCELSLLLLQVDRYATLATHNAAQATLVIGWVQALCRDAQRAGKQTLAVGPGRWAIVLPKCDRRAAVQIAGDLVRHLRAQAERHCPQADPPLAISVGSATVPQLPKNFAPQSLYEAAERCLYGAQSAGGNTAKSIEI